MRKATKAKIYVAVLVASAALLITNLENFGQIDDGRNFPKPYLAKKHAESIAGAIVIYNHEKGYLPLSLEKLKEEFFINDNGEKVNFFYGSYLDPWGNEYDYVILEDGTAFRLTCFGADGLPGGESLNADLSRVFYL